MMSQLMYGLGTGVLLDLFLRRGKEFSILASWHSEYGGGGRLAGSLAVKNSPETLLKQNSTSPQMLLRNLIQNGVTVEICPPYLPNKEKTTSDLIAGVSVAKPPQVADLLLDKDTKILSY
jgi:hypothetical protein